MPYKDKDKANAWKRRYYLNNKEKITKRQKEYQLKNKDKIKERDRKNSKRYYQENKEKIKLRNKEWKKRNPIKVREQQRRYVKKHREKVRERQKIYDKNRSPEYKKWKAGYLKNYFNKRKKEDKEFSLRCRLSIRLKDAFKLYTKLGKVYSSEEYGINYKTIIERLKPLPKDLSNYQIHHIKPLHTFNFINKDGSTNLEKIKKAFSPENHRLVTIEEHKKITNELKNNALYSRGDNENSLIGFMGFKEAHHQV